MMAAQRQLILWSLQPLGDLAALRDQWIAAAPEAADDLRRAELVHVANLDAIAGELPIQWLPEQRPAVLDEPTWRTVQARAHLHRRHLRDVLAVERVLGDDCTSELGCLTAAFHGTEAGRLVRSYRTHDVMALVVELHVNGDAERFDTVDLRGASTVHSPLGLMAPAHLALGGPSAKDIFSLCLQMTEFVGFLCGPWGIAAAGIAHLISAILAMREEHISMSEIVAIELDEKAIEDAVREINLIGSQYAVFVNSALSEAKEGRQQSQTHWVKMFDEFYHEHGRIDGTLGKHIALLHDKITQLVAADSPSVRQVQQLQHSIQGLVLALAVFSNIVVDLHNLDLALLSLDVESLEAAGAEPWQLDPSEAVEMFHQKTTWLDQVLAPQLKTWGIELFEKTLTPALDKWWKGRASGITWSTRDSIGTGRPGSPPHEQFQEIFDNGSGAFGEDHPWLVFRKKTRMPNVGSCCSPEFHINPEVQRALDAYIAETRAKFLKTVFGESFQEHTLASMVASWKSTLANIDDMKTIIEVDQQDRLDAWRKRAAGKGRKPHTLLKSVKVVRRAR